MTLEEAGAESIGTVIATLEPSHECELRAQVDELVKLGLIRKKETDLVLRSEEEPEPSSVIHGWRNMAISRMDEVQ